MKNGVGYITLTDGKVHFLFRPNRNVRPMVLSMAADTDERGVELVVDFALTNGMPLDRVCVAVDGRDCILRNYMFPVRSKRELDRVVSFELEDVLPMDQHELIHDYFKGDSEGAMSFVSVAALRRSRVEELLGLFDAHGVVVDRLDVDVAAFGRACGSQFAEYEQCVGLEIGTDRTLFCHLVKGKVRKVFVIPWGESLLVERFAKESGLSVGEADRFMVLDNGGDGDHQALYRKHMELFLRKLLREVYRLLGDVEIPSRFIVSGEIVRFQLFREVFTEGFDGTLDVWEERCLEPGLELDEGQRGSGVAVGYGNAEEAGGRFNFCKEEFASVCPDSCWKQDVIHLGTLLLCVLLAWGVYAYSSMVSGERELKRLNEATAQQYRKALPDLNPNMALMQYESILSAKLQALTGDTEGGPDESTTSVIETLRTVSKTVSRDIDVEFISLNLDGKRIDLQGEAGSMNDVDTIRAALGAVDIFKGVKIKNAMKDKRTSKIRFEMEVER